MIERDFVYSVDATRNSGNIVVRKCSFGENVYIAQSGGYPTRTSDCVYVNLSDGHVCREVENLGFWNYSLLPMKVRVSLLSDFHVYKRISMLDGKVQFKRGIFGFKIQIGSKAYGFHRGINGFYQGFRLLCKSDSIKAVRFRYMYIEGSNLICNISICFNRKGFKKVRKHVVSGVLCADIDYDFDKLGGEMFKSYLVFDLNSNEFIGMSSLVGLNTDKSYDVVDSKASSIIAKLALFGRLE